MTDEEKSYKAKLRRFKIGERLNKHFHEHASSNTSIFFILGLLALWLVTGPYYNYSEDWKFFINTASTFITILLVFILQRAQNKHSIAVHLKLNEIVAALKGASNRLIDAESLSEDELKDLARHYRTFSSRLVEEGDFTKPHSIEETREQVQIGDK
ncbi:hypothetical protein BH10BAC5_BH10BAC5_04420 [soil metagenome]